MHRQIGKQRELIQNKTWKSAKKQKASNKGLNRREKNISKKQKTWNKEKKESKKIRRKKHQETLSLKSQKLKWKEKKRWLKIYVI